ncbi:uncharacterized protein BO80DRAFT_54126 [Aspergillus ibericus CBS 121593]|uniref:Uncharacterized protein n=1 Tax=Aspergillus ibericus CBS 121593 TaxID=1448316 RepID=A0A395H1E5_9EURO|nr:hypothetical protein BO80DRAFT_54126 [Aspergillus ibericus CBS 121593]RAL01667.1 hypothetical protein BO80DRAFT_54126 [Aspergillus ibericus CBS 121593]
MWEPGPVPGNRKWLFHLHLSVSRKLPSPLSVGSTGRAYRLTGNDGQATRYLFPSTSLWRVATQLLPLVADCIIVVIVLMLAARESVSHPVPRPSYIGLTGTIIARLVGHLRGAEK